MKRILLLLSFVGLSLTAAFAQPCSLANLQVSTYTGSDGKCYADINFDMDRNNGNKFIYVHLWNAQEYGEVNTARWKKGAGPNKTDIDGSGNSHLSLATVAIDNNNYNAPIFSGYGYRPDPTVIAKVGTAISSTSTPVSGSGPHAYYRYTIYKILLANGTVSGGCMISNIRGIVWSTQANSQNSHIHCALIGANAPMWPLTISGNANCPQKRYTLSVTNNTTTMKQANFDLYADNHGAANGGSNNVFDPLVDTKFDSGYFAINGMSTFSVQRTIPNAYLGFNLWAQVVLSDGTTQMAKLLTSTCGTLPITMAYFNAVRSKQNVSLKWQTATELNVRGFEIERLTDGAWESVAFVNSKANGGSSASAINYDFNDINLFKGSSQYRLRIVDIDDKFQYSDIKTVKGGDVKSEMLIYPNPGKDGLVNLIFDEGNVRRDITVTDMSGRVVKQLKGVTTLKVTIDNLHPGMHTIQVVNRTHGTTDIEKVMISE